MYIWFLVDYRNNEGYSLPTISLSLNKLKEYVRMYENLIVE